MSQQWGSVPDPTASSGNSGHLRRTSGPIAPEVRPITAIPPAPPQGLGHGSGAGSPQQDAPRGQTPMLPPLQRLSDLDDNGPDRKSMRSLGVHAILNATQAEGAEPRGVRRTAAEMEAQSMEDRQPALPPLALSRPSSVESSYGDTSSPGAGVSTRSIPPRRILTPRSPTLQRVSSLGRVTGTIDAHQSPFLSPGPRNYTVEPGMGNVPPLPTPPAVVRARYEFPPTSSGMSTPPPPQPRRASMSGPITTTGATSPTASYTSYRQQGSMSPGMPYQPGNMRDEHMSTSAFPAYSEHSQHHPMMSPPSSYIPISTSGQQGVQMLTINTNKGPVQIPVESQAASRVADEKRKRNAGASARFRERRKIKEKESSQTISRLEQQVRDASEDAEYYRRERDFFANLVYQAPGGDRHFPRPPSPRRGRVTRESLGSRGDGNETASGSGSGSYSAFSEMSEPPRQVQGPPSEGRNTRRRTTGYSLPPPPTASSLPQSTYVSAFAPIVPAPLGVPAPHHSPPLPLPPGPGRYAGGISGPSNIYAASPPGQPAALTPRQGMEMPATTQSHDRSWTSGAQASRGTGPPGHPGPR
ncbi:hypothetical protein NA57DRAFT_52617 [Rhizodiscina lignyota]|uniref:BZIP domain-containing protein n=1 Tax=Rhizodiscina lignyota TaxID=1504668 RepID=A0A9P4IPM2_9PEZI|nr:hypothetical protein NA57DRAFT_52617 [Rhizodiscina lignyota]